MSDSQAQNPHKDNNRQQSTALPTVLPYAAVVFVATVLYYRYGHSFTHYMGSLFRTNLLRTAGRLGEGSQETQMFGDALFNPPERFDIYRVETVVAIIGVAISFVLLLS